MNVRPAGREACNCASPYNSILERLDAMEAEILAVQATANSAMGVANAQAGAAASSASAAAASATAAGNAAISAASDASDALTQATASAGSADDAADSAADALTALQTIEGTIASVLASDIGGKVDKLTTAGFYLYMHNGSTQGEVQPVVEPTAATIPIRDSDGRMQAADPASGATDKTLVTANWVSQTGDSAPNNLAHRTGDERYDGNKLFELAIKASLGMAYRINSAVWVDVGDYSPFVSTTAQMTFLFTERGGCSVITATYSTNADGEPTSITAARNNLIGSPIATKIAAVKDSDDRIHIYWSTTGNNRYVNIIPIGSYAGTGNVAVMRLNAELKTTLPVGYVEVTI